MGAYIAFFGLEKSVIGSWSPRTSMRGSPIKRHPSREKGSPLDENYLFLSRRVLPIASIITFAVISLV